MIQIIDYKAELKTKSEELLNEKIMKNEINSKMKILEAFIKEKNKWHQNQLIKTFL